MSEEGRKKGWAQAHLLPVTFTLVGGVSPLLKTVVGLFFCASFWEVRVLDFQ